MGILIVRLQVEAVGNISFPPKKPGQYPYESHLMELNQHLYKNIRTSSKEHGISPNEKSICSMSASVFAYLHNHPK